MARVTIGRFLSYLTDSVDVGAWLGSTAPTVGQKTMASSVPVVVSSDQSAIPVTGSFTLASVGATGAAVPASADQFGGPDAAGLLRAPRLFDLDTGGGTEFDLGVNLRFSGAGGSVEAGITANPFRVDPTGTTTQPVSGTVTANQGTAAGAAAPWSMRLSDGAAFYDGTKTGQLPAALVGGRLDENVGAWLGSTAPTVGQKTMVSSVPVVVSSDQSAIPVTGSFTLASVGATGAAVPASADQFGGPDAAGLLRAPRLFDLDTGGGTEFDLGVNLRFSGAGGSVEAGITANPFRVDPTGTTFERPLRT